VKDWPALARRLTADDPAARRFRENLPALAQGALKELAGTTPADVSPLAASQSLPASSTDRAKPQAADRQDAHDTICDALNALLPRRDFFDPDAFAAIPLPQEANAILRTAEVGGRQVRQIRPDAGAGDVLRLNRLLIERLFDERPNERRNERPPGANVIEPSRHGDVMRCFRLADGRELWRFLYPVRVKRFHGMSRTVPAVTEKYVVSLGPQWYAGQCPLIDGDRVILAPAGSSLLIAVELATGKVIWKTPNPDGWRQTHSSIAPAEIDGRKMYLYCGGKASTGGVVGVDAASGEVLWRFDDWRIETNVPTPVPLGDGRIFLSGGYGAGCMMIQVGRPPGRDETHGRDAHDTPASQAAGAFEAKMLWRKEGGDWDSAQHTPIFLDGFLYYTRGTGQFCCMGPDGQVAWDSGRGAGFGKGYGPFLIADGLAFVSDDAGTLVLAEATSSGYKELARAKLLTGSESWAPLALADGRLLYRDLTRMVCLDVRKGSSP
jgi:outer membrane protein assembly factor BamB